MTRLRGRAWFELVYSPDDGGWYATIIGDEGQRLVETDVYDTEREALAAMGQLADQHRLSIVGRLPS